MVEDPAELIESIERLIAEGADVDAFLDKIHRLISVAPMSVGSSHQSGVELYRATKHHRAVPSTIRELWYPPPEHAPLGRANRRGQPAFYCSSDPKCAFSEIGATAGQRVVHAKWVTTAPMVLHRLGYIAQVLTRAGSRRALPGDDESFYQSRLDEQGRAVRDFIGLAFTEPSSTKYALTTAIAEVHLRGDQFAGLIYPAVSRAANVDNLALRPEFVRTGLRLDTAQLVKLDSVGEDGSIGGVILCDLSQVEADGTLRWSFREQGSSVPPGGGYPLRPGDPLHVQSAGEIRVEGKRYRIEPGYLIEVSESGEVFVRDLRGNVVPPMA